MLQHAIFGLTPILSRIFARTPTKWREVALFHDAKKFLHPCAQNAVDHRRFHGEGLTDAELFHLPRNEGSMLHDITRLKETDSAAAAMVTPEGFRDDLRVKEILPC